MNKFIYLLLFFICSIAHSWAAKTATCTYRGDSDYVFYITEKKSCCMSDDNTSSSWVAWKNWRQPSRFDEKKPESPCPDKEVGDCAQNLENTDYPEYPCMEGKHTIQGCTHKDPKCHWSYQP